MFFREKMTPNGCLQLSFVHIVHQKVLSKLFKRYAYIFIRYSFAFDFTLPRTVSFLELTDRVGSVLRPIRWARDVVWKIFQF